MTTLGSQLWLHAWDTDEELARQIGQMLDAGLRLARVFLNWSAVEPAEDRRDFHLFDRFFAQCERLGMGVTPTLTCVTGEPRWFARRHAGRSLTRAEAAELDGHRLRHAREVAARYGKSPALHSWILANEPRLDLPLTEATLADFREYLGQRHPDGEAFTRLYGLPAIEDVGIYNDEGRLTLGLNGRWAYAGRVDWARFTQRTLCTRLRAVGNAVREVDAAHPTTINPDAITLASPLSGGRDLWAFSRCVDFLGLSCHVSWHSARFAARRIQQSVGMFCDMVRSASPERFHVTELQAGTNYFSGTRPMCPTAGDVTGWLWEAVGAGAEGIIYWLFHARDQGFEGLEWGLSRQNGAPSERTQASLAVARALEGCAAGMGRALPPDVYLLYDTDAMTLGEIEGGIAGGGGKDDPRTPHLVSDALCGAYTMLRDLGYSVGFCDGAGVAGLPDGALLVAPNVYAVRAETVGAIEAFGRRGTLIVDGLFAAKDEYGDANRAARGMLLETFGGMLEDFGVTLDGVSMTTVDGKAGDRVPGFYLTGWFAEGERRDVIARWPDGRAAAVRCGRNVWIGTQFFQGYFAREGEDEMARAFLRSMLPERGGPHLMNPSYALSMRALQGMLIVINRGVDTVAKIMNLPQGAKDAVTNEPVADEVAIRRDEVRLIRYGASE